MTRNVALVTRVTGHIGADIARILIDKGYELHGIERRASLFNTDRIDTLSQTPHVDDRRFILRCGDVTDSSNLIHRAQKLQPDEIYGFMSCVNCNGTYSGRLWRGSPCRECCLCSPDE